MSPVGAIFVLFPPKTGTKLLRPRPPAIVEQVRRHIQPIHLKKAFVRTDRLQQCSIDKRRDLYYDTRGPPPFGFYSWRNFSVHEI